MQLLFFYLKKTVLYLCNRLQILNKQKNPLIMKKTLLLFILTTMLSASINAQTKVWDFGTDTTFWPLNATGEPINSIKDNLGLLPGPAITNFGIVEANAASFPFDATSLAYTATKRFKMNGGGFESTATNQIMPTKRSVYFAANGSGTVKVWYKNGGSGTRTLFVTNGTSVIASNPYTNSTDALMFTATYTNVVGNIYLFADQSVNLYKIEVTGPLGTTDVLSTNNFQQDSSVSVFSNGKQVSVANVTSETQVNVYSMTGALVKSVATVSDINFELNSGFYIVNVKSAEGQKSVKVVVK